MIDYKEYQFSKREKIYYYVKGMFQILCISIFFYQNILFGLLLLPYLYFYEKQVKKELISNRKWNLNLQFKDGITSVLAALNAGYSIENAFEQAKNDLLVMYEEEDFIVLEFEFIINQLSMNFSVEKTLENFSERADIQDVYQFTQIFSTAKRTGGNLIHIIRITVKSITERIELSREIQTMVHAKKTEAKVMKIIPFLIILYLWSFSGGFLDVLYHNLIGQVIMTGLLIVYFFGIATMQKILDIKI